MAEQLINPFGDDDDDFSMNWIIDRNMQVSLLVVDDMHGIVPETEKDIYFGESPPDHLPYTQSSIDTVRQPYMGSPANLRFAELKRTYVKIYNYNYEISFVLQC